MMDPHTQIAVGLDQFVMLTRVSFPLWDVGWLDLVPVAGLGARAVRRRWWMPLVDAVGGSCAFAWLVR
jgi:hypothetical protein